jgi:hypothetical protein
MLLVVATKVVSKVAWPAKLEVKGTFGLKLNELFFSS